MPVPLSPEMRTVAVAVAALVMALGGCGIQPGAIIGKTNPDGTKVADREVDAGIL